MTLTTSKRSCCRLCESTNLSIEIQLPLTYVADKYSSNPHEASPLYPLDLYQCQDCGHIQVLDILPLELLFSSDYTYKPSRSKSLVQHFTDYASRFETEISHIPSKVLDIGSNDGLFLECLKEKYGCDILGIDPAKAPVLFARSKNIPTEHDFFNSDTVEKLIEKHGYFDVVSANNVFAHNDDLIGFAASVTKALTKSGVFCFEISYLVDIVERSLIGTIFHEHLSHHSLLPLDSFLKSVGLHLFHATPVSSQGGSLQCFATRDPNREKSPRLKELLEKEVVLGVTTSSYMAKFRLNISNLLGSFNSKLNSIAQNTNRIIAYGAARSANLLIEQLQLSNKLYCVIDNNEEKIGKFLFNSSTPILNEDHFVFKPGDLIIPLAWIHSNAIYQKLRSDSTKDLDGVKWLQFHPEVNLLDFN